MKKFLKICAFSSAISLHILTIIGFVISAQNKFMYCVNTNIVGEFYMELLMLIFSLGMIIYMLAELMSASEENYNKSKYYEDYEE